MGGDLPPAVRQALLGSEEAASFFSSLTPKQQQAAVANACTLSSQSDVDEFMRQSDNALFEDVCADEFREIGSKPL
jgi:hypothetical protein